MKGLARLTIVGICCTLCCVLITGCTSAEFHKIVFAYRNPNHWDDEYCQSAWVSPGLPHSPITELEAEQLESLALQQTNAQFLWLTLSDTPIARESRNTTGGMLDGAEMFEEAPQYAMLLYLARHGDPLAQLHLADFYTRMYFSPPNQWYISPEPVNSGLHMALFQAVGKWANRAVAAGANNAPCDYDFAEMYEQSHRVAANAIIALYWYRLSARQGGAAAQATLGELYSGHVAWVTPDPAKAYYWYHRAAQHGIFEAEYAMAVDYRYGRGTAPNAVKSAYWLGRAVAAGYQPAMDLNEHILLKPLVAAAASTGDPKTELKLALAYYNGRYDGQTIPIRHGKAAYWFGKCAPAGGARAEFYMGRCYQVGFGVPINFNLAAYWYQLSAKQGNSVAENNLGVMYQRGDYFPQSDAKAAACYMIAACKGNALAKSNLDGLLKTEIVESPHPHQFVNRLNSSFNALLAAGMTHQMIDEEEQQFRNYCQQQETADLQAQLNYAQAEAVQAQENAEAIQQQLDDNNAQQDGQPDEDAAPEPEPDPEPDPGG